MAKKKGAGKAAKVVDPAIAAAEEKRKEMIREADRLQKRMQFEEAEAEKMKLSYAQLARNWALDKSRVIALGDELRQKEGVVETLKDQQGAEIMELKKKLKDYLLDLHEEVVSEVIGGEELNKQAQDMQRDVRVGLRTDARGLKKTHKERELSKEELSRKLKRAHDQHSYEVRRDYERRLTEAKQQYDHDARVTTRVRVWRVLFGIWPEVVACGVCSCDGSTCPSQQMCVHEGMLIIHLFSGIIYISIAFFMMSFFHLPFPNFYCAGFARAIGLEAQKSRGCIGRKEASPHGAHHARA
jgi:hypothetical protein